jgi:phosphatidylinositol 4-kinase B
MPVSRPGDTSGRKAETTSTTLDAVIESVEGTEKRGTRRIVSLSTLTPDGEACNNMAPTGDVRREVLNAIMMTGKKGNTIAAGAADAVQRSLKELERKRATELLLGDRLVSQDNIGHRPNIEYIDLESTSDKMASLGLGGNSLVPKILEEEDVGKQPTDEDEAMEAIRLLLMQQRVAQGQLSAVDAAKVLQHASLNRAGKKETSGEGRIHPMDPSDAPTIDAGDIDSRLVGCGSLPPAVLQALTLWKGGMVTNGELLELVKKDIEFVRHSVLVDSDSLDKLNENSAFWGRFAFGERWAEKKARIAASSPKGSFAGWDLVGVIVKSNDDLRQEAFVMQLIELCQQAFQLAGLELWINPYRILATGRATGIIEMVRNAMSFDALKKRPGYGKGGLREHLQRMTEFTADPGDTFKAAQRNFVRSLASYSLMSYLFMFKDRHNGNLLLDTAGHIIHIDFGFVFGIAPGGSFSLEMSTPFKLTDEMLDVMGGLRSPLFSEFVTLFCCGFLALQSYCATFLTIVEIMCKDSTFKCFEGRDPEEIVSSLRKRFCPNLSKEETVAYALELINKATTSYGTKQYDYFQYLSQGIAA